MSAKQEKRSRQALRRVLEIDKQAEREQDAFAAACARVRMAAVRASELPIVRRDEKRRALAVVGLTLFAYAIASCIVAALRAH